MRNRYKFAKRLVNTGQSMEMNEAKEVAADILGGPPSIPSWEKLMDIVMSVEGGDQDALVAYILNLPALNKWDARYRSCPEGEWEIVESLPVAPIWWPLVQHLDYTTHRGDIGPFHHLKTILSLNILDGFVSAMENLSQLTQLLYLKIRDNEISFPCTEIASLTQLRGLSLTVIGFDDLAIIANLQSLDTLDLSFCAELTDISVLASLPKLSTLSLRGCESIADFSHLKRIPSLKQLDVRGTDFPTSLEKELKARRVKITR